MDFVLQVGAVAGAIAALVLVAGSPPGRWLFRRLLQQPLTEWVKGCAKEAIDETINGGVIHLNRRMSRMEQHAGLDPLPHQFEDNDPT